MFAVRNLFMVTLTAALAGAMSGCVTTGANLTSSAERLERKAYELRAEVREDGSSSYARDAVAFAEEARDFRRVVEDHRSDRDDVNDAFRDLSGRYHALRDEAERTRDDDSEAEFEAVTRAYLDTEREVRARDRYVRG
jgi:hypothetical protein